MTVQRVRAAANALTVIEAIANHQPVGVSELARATGLDKSMVQRLLMTLADAGWIVPAAGSPRRWQVSSKPLTLLHKSRALHYLELATQEMIRLREECNESVFVAAPQGGRMVIIGMAKTDEPLRVEMNVDDSFSDNSASWAAYLAGLPEEEASNFLTLSSEPELADRVEAARRSGYATLRTADTIVCAAALKDENDYPFATLALVAPRFRVGPDADERIGPLVAGAAKRCSVPTGKDSEVGVQRSSDPLSRAG